MSRRRAVVTGGNAGIGAATARELARRGMDVWLTYHSDEEGARAVVASLRQLGTEARASRVDLADPAVPEVFAKEIAREWDSLHVIVNNAGACPHTPYEEISVEEWDVVLAANLRGPFLLIRALVPLLRAAEGDRAIVNVSSMAGQTGGVIAAVHYAASKAGMLSLTRSFSRLLAADGIRVNSVTPGPVITRITDRLSGEARAKVLAGVPLGRFAEPEEIAATIVFLASPESSFTTGAIYDVNGGLRVG